MAYNRVNAQLPDDEREAILAALKLIREKLPFLVGVSPAQRRKLAKIGSTRYAFVQRTLILAEQNPEILPGVFSVANFRRDVELMDALRGVFAQVVSLREGLDDTLLVVGHEAYRSALTVYAMAKADSSHGLDTTVKELSQTFPRRARKQSKTAQATEAKSE